MRGHMKYEDAVRHSAQLDEHLHQLVRVRWSVLGEIAGRGGDEQRWIYDNLLRKAGWGHQQGAAMVLRDGGALIRYRTMALIIRADNTVTGV